MTVSSGLPRAVALAALLAALAGCSATSLDSFPTTAQIVERGNLLDRGPVLSSSAFQAAAGERARVLLRDPLTLPAAMEIAMLNAAALQGIYQEQQVFHPGFVDRLAGARATGGDALPVEWTALRLALLPAVDRESRYDFADTYARVVAAFIATAETVRKTWYTAVAATQADATMQQAVEAMKAQAELANEQYRSGAASRGEQAKRHLALGAVLKEHAAAKRRLVEAREVLIRTLGLWSADGALTLPPRLPELPAGAVDPEGIEELALRSRPDLIDARRLGGAWATGVMARSQVREAHASYLAAYETARYQRDTVMPLAQVSLQFAQRQYNGMLIGIYDLLAEIREQIEAGRDYVDTLRDFWIADATLTRAVGGVLPGQSPAAGGPRP